MSIDDTAPGTSTAPLGDTEGAAAVGEEAQAMIGLRFDRPLVRKRCILWDFKNSVDFEGQKAIPFAFDEVPWDGPVHSVSNWNAWVPPELRGRADFRPMVRERSSLEGNDWAMILNTPFEIIHYFNEPERHDISPGQAADFWVSHMLPLRVQKGKRLVGPSCASDPNGTAWLDAFMNDERVRANMPDFLGLHYYGTSGDHCIQFLSEQHGKYLDLPVIVSEIASIHRNRDDVWGFTMHLCNWMDETPWVFEYAFFGAMPTLADDFVSPEAQLIDANGHWTYLGRLYLQQQPLKPWG
jgi:hypothetical protein